MSVLVAGNSVLDLHLLVDDDAAGFDHGWVSDNVQFLDSPPNAVLGGNGAATSYALGRLGVPVHLNTAIGSDAFGDVLAGWLTDAEVVLVGAPTGSTAVNVVRARGRDGARNSSFYPGRKIDWSAGLDVFSGGWFFASGYGQVDASDFAPLVAAFDAARLADGHVCFDPGPWFARSVSPDEFRSSVSKVDYLIGTEDELRSWSDTTSVADLVADYIGLGVGSVVVKRGRDGASFGDAVVAIGDVSGTPVEGAHAVGAGDTFNGALLASLYRGAGTEESCRAAVQRAETAVRNGRGVLGAFD